MGLCWVELAPGMFLGGRARGGVGEVSTTTWLRLTTRPVARVLELVGPGELELAVDQFLRCTGWRPDELLLGRLLGLARELGVDTEKYLRRWDEPGP